MKSIIFILSIFISSQAVFAQTLEAKSVELLKSFIPQGKTELNKKGVIWNTSEPCILNIKYYYTPQTPFSSEQKEVVVALIARNYQLFSKFNVRTAVPQPANLKVIEFKNTDRDTHIVRLTRENNQYAPVEKATLEMIKSTPQAINGAYILVQYGAKKHSELRCKF